RLILKKLICVFASIFLCLNIFAADGNLWGTRTSDLKVLKTEWFDIIFPPESQESAVHLYNNADRIYSEIAELYGHAPICRLPVVLTPQVERYNAYFSLVPYNLIVIYDTIPTEEMLVSSDSLLETFRHELTHAYTYNLKSPELYKSGLFFGDALILSVLSLSGGWAEGATLTSESAGGEGRLNDEYSLHMVKQAKIEKQFPKYSDVQGASDRYPLGSFYNFNACFAEWLQKTYGMEKYAEFWYSCINGKHFFASTSFKAVYGLKLKEAWAIFTHEFAVPDVEPNPVAAGLCHDFFDYLSTGGEKEGADKKKNDYSLLNDSGALYTNLCKSEKGLYFIDDSCNAVYFVEANTDGQSGIDGRKIKKLFTHNGLNQIAVSRDGRFIAVQYDSQNEGTYKERIKIYDCKKETFFDVDGTSKMNPAIICRDQNGITKYYLVYTQFQTQKTFINIEDILTNKTKTVMSIPLGTNVYDFSFVDIGGDGIFAFIKCDALKYSICGMNLQGQILFEYELPSSTMRLRGLSYSDGNLYFSYTDKGTLPRLGSLNLTDNSFNLQQNDVSGGVFTPVMFDGHLYYTGRFYRQNRLFIAGEKITASASSLSDSTISTVSDSVSSDFAISTVSASNSAVSAILNSSGSYNTFNYIKRGIFIPVSIATSKSYYQDFSSSSYSLPFGITYITASPWTSGNYVTLSAGYGYETNSFGSNLQYNGGTDTSLFNYSLRASTEFDFNGWKLAESGASASFNLPCGAVSRFSLFDSVFGFVGKNNLDTRLLQNESSEDFIARYFAPGGFAPISNDLILYAYNDCGVKFSNVHYAGSGKYERAGFSLVESFTYSIYKNLTAADDSGKILQNGNLTSELNVYIPRLLPFNSKAGFTYNLPLKLSVAVFPYDTISKKVSSITKSENICFENAILNFDAQTVLFSTEIQKAAPLIPVVFANELTFILRYNSAFTEASAFTWGFLSLNEHFDGIFTGNKSYKSLVELRMQLGLTPNLGESARYQFRTDFYVSMLYSFEKNKISGEYGISASF
ncbi:MAG: hypothetical protein K6A43_10100, partial [Treponema sp.]|nr:hypothetical protein [Treponema sp.]